MTTSSTGPIDVAEIAEITALARQIYDFDFSGYAKASLKRRIVRVMQLRKMNFYDLKHALINDASFFRFFLEQITVNVTEMFRDPALYRAFSDHVLPHLASYPHIKVWSAGCSTGEEAYSLAILLKESQLYQRSFIYGTDVNPEVVKKARKGIYSLSKVRSYAENYKNSGLGGSITDNFTVLYDAASIRTELKQNTLFSVHNLITDQVFNDFQLITCRNVFIYFERALQERVLDLFYRSLCPLGFLCLGIREAIRSDSLKGKFRVIDARQNIYQKIAN